MIKPSTFTSSPNLHGKEKCHFQKAKDEQLLSKMISCQEPATAAMHGLRSVFDTGHCTVIICDAGGVSWLNTEKQRWLLLLCCCFTSTVNI